MKRWQTWLVKFFHLKGTLNTEKALRSVRKQSYESGYEDGLKDGVKIQQQFIPAVYIDPAGQKQAQSQIGTYEPPERTTDKPMVFPETHGRYFREQRKEFEETKTLPVFPKPRKLHFQRLYAEPDSTFNAL